MSFHIAVVDLGYGDSGKGIFTARLAETEQFKIVVKASGGCQCAHNVVARDGTHFTFSQFGSGTFSRVPTYLTKDFLVEPFALLREAQGLAEAGVEDPLRLMHVAWNALMVTPYHWLLNRWEEDQRGEARHGSTGRGIGTTARYALEHPEAALVVGDINNSSHLYSKLFELRAWVIAQGVPAESLPTVPDLFERYHKITHDLKIVGSGYFQTTFLYNRVIFEGSQGVLLDEDYGFHPHTTWSHTTDHKAHVTAESLGKSDIYNQPSRSVLTRTVGVTRTYTTRHGFGPFVTESDDVKVPEPDNDYAHYQGAWRQGHLDLVALRYAIKACQRMDGIYVTHTDSVDPSIKWCEGYEKDGQPFELEHIDPQDFEARQRLTESLYKASPVLAPAPSVNVAQRLAEGLGKPLLGQGWGPRIDQGEFYDRIEWML